MRQKLVVLAAVIAAFAITCQGVDAHGRKHLDKRIAVVSLGVGAASTATYFGINDWRWKWQASNITSFGAWAGTTIGCMAVAPMVATLVVDRPLTMREAHILAASCVVPIIGGWLVNEAYNAHPEWEADDHPPMKKHHHKMKKM